MFLEAAHKVPRVLPARVPAEMAKGLGLSVLSEKTNNWSVSRTLFFCESHWYVPVPLSHSPTGCHKMVLQTSPRTSKVEWHLQLTKAPCVCFRKWHSKVYRNQFVNWSGPCQTRVKSNSTALKHTGSEWALFLFKCVLQVNTLSRRLVTVQSIRAYKTKLRAQEIINSNRLSNSYKVVIDNTQPCKSPACYAGGLA